MIHEKRKYPRIQVFPIIVQVLQGNSMCSGFITDLSLNGSNLWLSTKVNALEFTLSIRNPNQYDSSPILIQAIRKWEKIHPQCEANILGCQFININDRIVDNITRLLSGSNKAEVLAFV